MKSFENPFSESSERLECLRLSVVTSLSGRMKSKMVIVRPKVLFKVRSRADFLSACRRFSP